MQFSFFHSENGVGRHHRITEDRTKTTEKMTKRHKRKLLHRRIEKVDSNQLSLPLAQQNNNNKLTTHELKIQAEKRGTRSTKPTNEWMKWIIQRCQSTTSDRSFLIFCFLNSLSRCASSVIEFSVFFSMFFIRGSVGRCVWVHFI